MARQPLPPPPPSPPPPPPYYFTHASWAEHLRRMKQPGLTGWLYRLLH